MNETKTMLEIWRKWEAQIDDLGKDLAVTSAMNEYAELQVKNLNLHGVSGSFIGLLPELDTSKYDALPVYVNGKLVDKNDR